MQTSYSEVSMLTIFISTLLLFIVGSIFIYYFFRYQKKRHLHQKEIFELRETFKNTLLQSKLEIQEHTLDHISKELHANFSHLVSLINLNLSAMLPGSSEELKESIQATKSLAKELMGELKVMSISLNTDRIMQIGFTAALEDEINRLGKTKKYETTFIKKGQEKRIKPEYAIILFRLCQEILNNIVKHAEAKSITAVLDYLPNLLTLQISDDGRGFDTATGVTNLVQNGSTGLMNMENRAKLIRGNFRVKSEPGKGTTCIVTIPTED